MPVIGDKFGKASISTDYAVATTVKTTRVIGATVLEAFDLSKFAPDTPVFFVTYKKTTDPVTGIVSVTNQISWKAIVNTGANTLTNLTLAPGYVDSGNAVGDFIECIPTSYWGNSLIEGISVSINADGTLKMSAIKTALGGDAVDPVVRDAELIFDHVIAGSGVIAGLGYGTTLTASISGGFCYINGNRQIITAVATRSYTINKDTYVDLLYNASGTATVVYTEVANNAASPALAANSIRLGIVVTNASSIPSVANINQGEIGKTLPIASSVRYEVTDSLGNLICPRDATRRTLGYKSIGSLSTSSTTDVAVTGSLITVNIPASLVGRKAKLSTGHMTVSNTTASLYISPALYSGTAVSGGTMLGRAYAVVPINGGLEPVKLEQDVNLVPGTMNFLLAGQVQGGTGSLSSYGGEHIKLELV